MEYIKINGTEYPTEGVSGLMRDNSWDGRESKTITFSTLSYEEVKALFTDGAKWQIVSISTEERLDEEGKPFPVPQLIAHREVYDNSEFCVAGAITDHRDGRVSVKMGKALR